MAETDIAMPESTPVDSRPAFAIVEELKTKFGENFYVQATFEEFPTVWVERARVQEVLMFLRKVERPYVMLFDLSAMDERLRQHRDGLPASDFTVFYHLLSLERNSDIRIKVALNENDLNLPTATNIWPNANWYEREAYDMFGINFEGHPMLRRILLPTYWEGHPLRKEYSARATEYTPYMQDKAKQDFEQEHLRFVPEDWGLKRGNADEDFMFLNLGPNHPSAHGAFRIVLQLDGEEVKDCVPDIGYHHRGVEKMAERQTWHSFITYTDRVDYLGGCAQNMPYVMAVEQLAGIKVPERAQVIRVMLNELFRINNHLLYCGTAIQDAGGMTPVFYMFADRQKVYDIVEAITGYRMHPAWFRIGGTAHDLPNNWQKLVKELLDWMPKRLNEYYTAAFKNSVFIGRTRNVAQYDAKSALAWGVTGTGLRATGIDFDVRKYRPYSGYENFDFEVPVEYEGDAYARVLVHFREIEQSLKIIKQCLDNMPSGPYKADHPLAVPPPKDKTLQDIETLITHFLSVSWGPVMPAGEASFMTEVVKGASTYYLTSDKATMSYRTRIRTPTFTNLQQIPSVINGSLVSDLIIYLATIDVVMADVDR
ncbi:NADH-quinone oxidoreductase subunit C/D [Acinetobacter baumannii 25493_4]|nr:NADH-quinone oxidoreductase subunit C/D [Acinetobacter baumannii 25493_4]